MSFELPPRSSVGYLDPEIANEGQKVTMSDGEQVSWNPPPANLVIPDLSKVKSLAKYFHRTGYVPYPTWVYHPKEQPKILKNATEARELGIYYRKATADENARYGRSAVWDWDDGCEWRVTPFANTLKFDPAKPGQGKTYMASTPTPRAMQHDLLEAVLPQVTAAVMQALRAGGAPTAPSNVDAKDWEEFQQFLAFKKSAQVLGVGQEEAAEAPAVVQEPDPSGNALNALSATEERALWVAEAERKGIKVDGRWSLDRIKAEVEKAA